MSKYTRNCKYCGSEFVTNTRKKKYCTIMCQKEWQRLPENQDTFESICQMCGEVFKGRKNAKYCSQQCNGQGRSTKGKTKPCLYCGKQFGGHLAPSKLDVRKYCSGECRAKDKTGSIDGSKWDTFTCQMCGKVFDKYSFRKPKFCSKECADENLAIIFKGEKSYRWRGGSKGYGKNWNNQKRKVKKRDGSKCQLCGAKKTENNDVIIDVHHIKPFRTFDGDYKQANQLRNLISLCRACHAKVEWHGYPCPVKLL